jgi:hypothetical protein
MQESKKLNYVKPTAEEILLSVNERIAACGSVPPPPEVCGAAAASAWEYYNDTHLDC